MSFSRGSHRRPVESRNARGCKVLIDKTIDQTHPSDIPPCVAGLSRLFCRSVRRRCALYTATIPSPHLQGARNCNSRFISPRDLWCVRRRGVAQGGWHETMRSVCCPPQRADGCAPARGYGSCMFCGIAAAVAGCSSPDLRHVRNCRFRRCKSRCGHIAKHQPRQLPATGRRTAGTRCLRSYCLR